MKKAEKSFFGNALIKSILAAVVFYGCNKDSTQPLPAITDLSPKSGYFGTSVTVTGINFSPSTSNDVVKFNGTAATVTQASATSLTAAVPSGATSGAISVTINGQTVRSSSSFTVLLPPTITTFQPTSGSVGKLVTITGTGFDPIAANNIVSFNGMMAIVTKSSIISLTATVPSGAASGAITVTINGQIAKSSSSFTVLQSPAITAFQPASGSIGTSVTITGSNFDPIVTNDTIKFNGTVATVTQASTTSLTATVPSGATSGGITVSINGLIATSSESFVVLQTPTIATCQPASGLIGANVIITGTNFDPIAANDIVKFNGTVATVTQASPTSLTATVPSGATTGGITITVNGQTVASDFVFTLADITTALVAYYPLAGDTKDYSGNGNDLVPTNITYGYDHNGSSNSAAFFDGSTSKAISKAVTSFDSTPSPLSISMWLYLTSEINYPLWGHPLGSTNYSNLIYVETVNFGVGMGEILSETYVAANGAILPSTDGWYHFVGVFDPDIHSIIFYSNGIPLKTTSNINLATLPSMQWELGFSDYYNSFWSGALSEIRVFNRALTQADVTALYHK